MPWLERIVARNPALPVRPILGYPAAAAAVAAAYGLRIALGQALTGLSFITFSPAIAAAAVVGGTGPGLFATALSVVAIRFGPMLSPWSGADWEQPSAPAIGIFVVNSLLFCLIVHGFYTALTRLRNARRRLSEALTGVEAQVAERTRQLGEANQRLQAEMAEREKAQEVVRQSQKLALIGQLAGGIAHDFNNLLTVILGNAESAQRRLGDREPEVRTRIAACMRGAERAVSLVHRLLAFARQQPLDVAPVNLNKLIAGMSDLIRRTLGARIEIETVLAGGLWRTLCDANQMEAALLNLIINARDAMPDEGRLTIETANAYLDEAYAEQHEEVTPGQYVMVAVTDTGCGMPAEIVERAFDPFFTTKPAGEGTGLGLSMVFGFVKQSGGHVKIYSEPGRGTSVKVYLPRLLGEAAEREQARTPVLAERAAEACTVLVVEDHPDVRAFAVQSLTELGYRVCEAGDGAEATRILHSEPGISVLLSDVVLPNTDLRALIDEAKRLHAGLRVIYTTGYTRNAIVHGGILDSHVDLLPKPFTVAALARKMREVLNTPRPPETGPGDK